MKRTSIQRLSAGQRPSPSRPRAPLLAVMSAIACVACGQSNASPPALEADRPDGRPDQVYVSPRTQSLDTFPCSECHHTVTLQEPTLPPREPHRDLVFAHMPNAGHCYQCHNRDDLDTLRLFTGELVSFDDTQTLCGQCHPAQKRDWDWGIHGKQVGSWRGLKHRYACAACHDPHSPKRPAVKAYPPPSFPHFGIRKEAH